MSTNFPLATETELLNEQLKLIKPQLIVKMELDIGDGIKYINNPFGYIRERDTRVIKSPPEIYEINLNEN
ncbi:unnamed protein product [Rotaria magnacalcarata]|uniref:Uncharacterized protein n=1 Tax=Rotaria magnacalcarata TaxID=392030 RepID=A0A816M0W6_9BILA|nr:unnamed protein product [Rotaria magnacalcarata]